MYSNGTDIMLIIQAALLRYYIALGWWFLKFMILFVVLIPGTLPVMIGYLASVVYRLVDPNYIVFEFIRQSYIVTVGSLPLIGQIIILKLIVLSMIFAYMKVLRRKHPKVSWVEISKLEIVNKLRYFSKPKRPTELFEIEN